MLNQRLADMKKTLQNELKTNGNGKEINTNGTSTSINGAANINPNELNGVNGEPLCENNSKKSPPVIMDDVNFRYLKHVILKFLTSREVSTAFDLIFAENLRIPLNICNQVEARHLIKAIGTLLNLNADEEQLLHETLNFKVGWFGSRSHMDMSSRSRHQKLFSIPSPLSS